MIIKDVDKKIDTLLKEHNLTPEEPLEDYFKIAIKDKKNYYTVICKNDKGDKFIFKMLISDSESFRRALIREITFSNMADNYEFETLIFPRLIFYDLKDLWYLRRCYEGTMIGDANFMYEKYSNQIIAFAEKAIECILEINRLKIEHFEGEYLKTYPYYKYLASIIKNKSAIVRTDKAVYDKCLTIFEENCKYLYQEAIICHGDFHPGNIIFNQEKPTMLDWACVHMGNMANDFTKFWLSLWQFPEAQNHAADLFLSKLDSKEKTNFDRNLTAMIIYHGFPRLGRAIYLMDHRKLAEGYGSDVVSDGYEYFFNNLFNLKNLNNEIYLRREINDKVDALPTKPNYQAG